MTSFEEIWNYFKLRNGSLNSKLCAKRKLLHSDENAYVFFVKKETLKLKLDSLANFVPLYFSLRWTFLLTLFSGAIITRARKLCFLLISENYYTNYNHLLWLFGSKKGNINF